MPVRPPWLRGVLLLLVVGQVGGCAVDTNTLSRDGDRAAVAPLTSAPPASPPVGEPLYQLLYRDEVGASEADGGGLASPRVGSDDGGPPSAKRARGTGSQRVTPRRSIPSPEGRDVPASSALARKRAPGSACSASKSMSASDTQL